MSKLSANLLDLTKENIQTNKDEHFTLEEVKKITL